MRNIGYNSQRNNIIVNNLSAWSQCFSTSNWMRMSFYCQDIKANDDEGLSEFVKYCESGLGKKMDPSKHPSIFFEVQAGSVTKWLNDRGIEGRDIVNVNFTIDGLIEKLKSGPLTIGTQKMGGLKNGHIVLMVDFDEIKHSFIVHDPFGYSVTNYKDYDGKYVVYPVEYILPYIHVGNEFCRIQYWQKAK